MSSTFWLTTLAMIAFAGNSILARLALGEGAIDAAGYTGVRLASGAAVLALLLVNANRKSVPAVRLPGGWPSALALFVYAVAFSYAYLQLGAAVGALVLFASVQATMIAWGLIRGERPGLSEIAGLTIAFAAFVYWIAPALVTPALLGTVLMIASGVAWGVYSLRGRAATDPMGETAGNFIRTVPLAIPLIALSAFQSGMTTAGIVIAIASGAVTSGLGYVLWYRALPGLTATRASIVQLTVPVIAALGGVLFLAEALTLRFVLAATLILGGIALALLVRKR
ncbi:MAG TPA: DMT family transporter [Aurantimonas coralicida]|uniref:DMT family transporter n=2 Tax=root TaxID=1 RepID=A0A9C9NJ84_9HYPH|nr:DMT family transporter [Aurantimonas coralicida]HEU02079.1 DMT family transporter [Aurantimonas coralicida]